jgi:hypothetical protein
MASPLGTKGTIAVKVDGKGTSIDIHVSEPPGVKAENLSLSTWGASYILASHLHNITLPSHPIRNGGHHHLANNNWILELGAGTGVVGLAAAAIWKANVVLTDLPSILPGLAANITANTSLLMQCGGSTSYGYLDWTHPLHLSIETPLNGSKTKSIGPNNSKPSVILAADTVYTEDHPELLSRTILTWLSPTAEARAVLCYPLRIAYLNHVRSFWEMMETGGLECIDEGREEGREEWNEIASTPYEWCVWRWKE